MVVPYVVVAAVGAAAVVAEGVLVVADVLGRAAGRAAVVAVAVMVLVLAVALAGSGLLELESWVWIAGWI